jgi:hypothetical protein
LVLAHTDAFLAKHKCTVVTTSAACVRAPTHQIAGMGEAYRIAKAEMRENKRIRMLQLNACSMV